MSAGHRTGHKQSTDFVREYERLMADPRVVKYLARSARTDLSHEMPLTGGSTIDGRTYFLDPKLKRRYDVGKKKGQDLSAPVLRHERVEKALRDVLGMSYDRAHAFATHAEKQVVEGRGMDWTIYKDVMESIVRRDERERPKSLPAGYDYGPLRASGGLKSLRGLRAS